MAKDNDFGKMLERANRERENPPSSLQETEALPSIPDGVLTLLDVPNRKPLPEIPSAGRRVFLYDIIATTPQTYAQFIMHMRSGAYWHVAAEAVGIGTSTIYEWGKRGRKDLLDGKDTYYSRFVLDTRRAIAECRVVAERWIMEHDPKKWLSLGPGNIFGNEWVENPVKEEPESTNDPFQEPKRLEEKKVDDTYHLGVEEQIAAMEALEAAGQVILTDEYKDSLRKQSKKRDDNVTPEPQDE